MNDQLKVGNLATLTSEDYPGMGNYFVQIWNGDSLFARIYGDTPDEARQKAHNLVEQMCCLREWLDKTEFIQEWMNCGSLPLKYLGKHRADIIRELLDHELLFL